jgi:hypothetical protein
MRYVCIPVATFNDVLIMCIFLNERYRRIADLYVGKGLHHKRNLMFLRQLHGVMRDIGREEDSKELINDKQLFNPIHTVN